MNLNYHLNNHNNEPSCSQNGRIICHREAILEISRSRLETLSLHNSNKVFCDRWSYEFYDIALATDLHTRRTINGVFKIYN